MNKSEYYILRWGDANIYPAVEGDNVNLSYLQGNEKLEEEDVPLINLCFGEPVPTNPVMADYHPVEPVFSSRVASVIKSFNLAYIQVFPAVIRGINNKLFDYCYVYISNFITCLDFEKSDCEMDEVGGADNLNTIVLDETKLNLNPLVDRLIFKLDEAPNFILFHESVVDSILSLNPVGIRFIKLEDYYDGIEFD